jgi:hypothetical protein
MIGCCYHILIAAFLFALDEYSAYLLPVFEAEAKYAKATDEL